ncbi:hypothetical protein LSM04_008608 [Trypanosoma melophagium]|uniref:uncharacterized protein n=1 Tax=Trypanosoma melophagium TaxID=715481 RepID=UPI00351A880B|nr:hypothetical protein LSM04_008608 [Trypanosoma melophagium]
MRRISPITALRGSTAILCHISSLDPYTRTQKMASSNMSKLLLNGGNNSSLGLQFNLFPLSSATFEEYIGMQHYFKQTITTLENVISTSDAESVKVDYIVFRYSESLADENLWKNRIKLSLSFLRELGERVLPTIPLVLSIPVTMTNKMTLSYVEDIFETLHRVGWTNILLELPQLSMTNPVKKTHPFYRSSGILKNWELLLQSDVDESVLSSQCKPISLTRLFPWILQEGFLSRFSVGLSVDVRSSLQSLTLLQQEEMNGNVEKTREDVMREKKECHTNKSNEKEEDKVTTWMREGIPKNNSQRLAKDKYCQFTEMVKKSQKGLKESGMITLDAPPKEFTDMLLAQQQSSQMKNGGMEEETIMLAQLLQQTFNNSDAKKKYTEIQKDKKKEPQISEFLTNQSDINLNKLQQQQQQQRSGHIYWKLLGEIAQRTQAQYLCTAPCINPVSLKAWKQSWITTCMMCNRNEIKDEPFLSKLGLLPVVNALWPLLSPTQVERERRLASSNELIQSNGDIEDELLFAPLYLKQELESAIVKIPPSILQHAFNSVVVQKRGKRSETQIIHDGGSLRLCCSSRRLHNGGETSDDALRILGAGEMGRKSLLSKIPAEQTACVREVEMMFRDNSMKRVFGEMIHGTRVENNDDSYSSHLLLAVPPDTEPSVLLESLRFLRSTSS